MVHHEYEAVTLKIDLTPELEASLLDAAKAEGLSVEEYATSCLSQRLAQQPVGSAGQAWRLGQELFGAFDSGRSDVSQNDESVLEELLKRDRDRNDAD